MTVRLRHATIHAAGCESCETKEGLLDRIEREVELVGPLDEEQWGVISAFGPRFRAPATILSGVLFLACAGLSVFIDGVNAQFRPPPS